MTRLATDVGGTFTDLVSWDERDGSLTVAKELTTPRDQSDGVMAAVAQSGLDPAAVRDFVHGGTTVINALTERKGVRTALVTTRGFRDVLAIGRGNRPDLYNLQFETPRPFVPRRWRFEVTERIGAGGEVVTPLDESELAAIAAACKADGIEAMAICLLHSYRNPAHEIACGERLAALLPGVAITLSSTISREWREFERTSTTVLNAYVQPIVQRYFDGLERRLREVGLAAPLQAMQSNGGTASFDAARRFPLALVESGPAAGVNGAVVVGRAAGSPDLIAFDVGGTTAKCSLIRGGMATVKTDYWIERTRFEPGYPLMVPVVDIVEVGAGGGSIARIDASDRLRVGPESAGADPGPACYSRGGTAATVTDAKLLTGVLDENSFSGGRMRPSRDLAGTAMQPIADHLGLDVVAAASAVIELAEANMINALKLVSVQRGHDPRDFAMLAYGGGGPMHAATLTRELGLKELVVPLYPGLFSAWGMLATAPRHDQVRTLPMPAADATREALLNVFAEMVRSAQAYFGVDAGGVRHIGRIDLRYHGQEHTVSVPVDPLDILPDRLIADFHDAHERAYTFRLDDTGVEVINFRLASEELRSLPELRPLDPSGRSLDGALVGRRMVQTDARTSAETPVYDRDRLPVGERIEGPAIIVEPTSTTQVLPGQVFEMDGLGLLRIREG